MNPDLFLSKLDFRFRFVSGVKRLLLFFNVLFSTVLANTLFMFNYVKLGTQPWLFLFYLVLYVRHFYFEAAVLHCGTFSTEDSHIAGKMAPVC